MENTVLDAVWLNEGGSCSIVHLQEVSGLDRAELQALIDSGALSPLSEEDENPAFVSSAMLVARTARRLRDDFALEPNGLALAMQLVARVAFLERELERLRARTARPPSTR
nr:chaperone modulator CbpM [uncultured Noviherbaspirillum sp.]